MSAKKPPPRELLRRAFTLCLRALRKDKQLAQEELAAMAEIDRAYMGALERGEHSPTLEMLYRIIAPLDITFVEFAERFEASLRRVRRERNDSPA